MQLAIEIVKPSAELKTPPEFFDWMLKWAEWCGLLSHKNEDKQTDYSAERFLRKWTIDGKTEQSRHESILEHVGLLSFHLVMSRCASHQLVRHRIGVAYTQESQRYCDYSHPKYGNCLKVICPPSIADADECVVVASLDGDDYTYALVLPDGSGENIHVMGEPFVRFARTCLRAYGNYLWLREQKVPPEDARFVLPNAAKTEIAVTCNARALRHFFRMRLDKHAQWEVRSIAGQMHAALVERMPALFDDEEMRALRAATYWRDIDG